MRLRTEAPKKLEAAFDLPWQDSWNIGVLTVDEHATETLRPMTVATLEHRTNNEDFNQQLRLLYVHFLKKSYVAASRLSGRKILRNFWATATPATAYFERNQGKMTQQNKSVIRSPGTRT